jgi:hypothetical protein
MADNPLEVLQRRGWVTLRDFSKIANVSYPTVNRWARLEMVRFVQVGGQKRVYEEEIRRFLEFGTLPGSPDKLAAEKAARINKQQSGAQ